MRAAMDATDDQPGLLEHLQMTRHRRLRDAQAASRLADRRRTLRQALDHLEADGMGERAKRIVSQSANNLHFAPKRVIAG